MHASRFHPVFQRHPTETTPMVAAAGLAVLEEIRCQDLTGRAARCCGRGWRDCGMRRWWGISADWGCS